MKKIKVIENVLYFLVIVIICFLRSMDNDLASIAFIFAGLFVLIALCLPQWEKNNYRWNLQSVPGIVQVIGLIALSFFFVLINSVVCSYRLGIPRLLPNFLGAVVAQSLTFLIGAGIYGISYPKGNLLKPRTVAAIAFSMIAVYLLNFVFYSNPGDLQAEFRPTERCYPGGACYSAGPEQWGGYGALLLLTVNLLQGILVLNAAAGIYRLSKK